MAATDDQPVDRRSRRTVRVILSVIAALLLALLAVNYWPAGGQITISRETTHILDPLNEDGTINYVAALNERLSKGVTPENNAAPLLIRALGPRVLDSRIKERLMKLLGIEYLPENGDYFVPFGDYLEIAPARPGTRTAVSLAAGESRKEIVEALGKDPWSSRQRPGVAAWLVANEKALSLIVEAAKRPRYYLPLVSLSAPPDLVGVPIPFLDDDVIRALLARGMLKLHRGNVDGAQGEILAACRIARLWGQGHTVVERFVSLRTEYLAHEAAIVLVARGKLTAEQARAFRAELETLPPAADPIAALDQYQRFMGLDVVMVLARARNPMRLLENGQGDDRQASGRISDAAHWDYILRSMNDMYDTIVKAARCTDPRQREKYNNLVKGTVKAHRRGEFGSLLARYGGRIARPVRTDVLTATLVVILPIISDTMVSRQQVVKMYLELLKLSLALAAFKAEKREYPAELAALVPAYIKAIPQDVFSGKPLIYKRDGKGYLLYSIGPNMKDDGGVEDKDADKDDVAVRVK